MTDSSAPLISPLLGNLIGAMIVLMLLIFIGIWIWAWSSRHKATFDQLARLPMKDDPDDLSAKEQP